MIDLRPSRELLRVVTEGTPVLPTPKDAGRCSEARFIVNDSMCYVVTLNGAGSQVLHEPVERRYVYTRGLQLWVDIYQHVLNADGITEERRERENG